MRHLKKTGVNKTTETGAIMLEVVAVLALMGVMGATLFRQIYQRNQELHNIQMASEIRTVKEALSAYIQANRATIIADCIDPGDDIKSCSDNNAIAKGVMDYLPAGWFSDFEDELKKAYSFSIWNYYQDDITNRRVIYGVVAPTANTLPTTGWNFKRAARVALLIGADGGAYGRDITGKNINGSLGSWELLADGIIPGDVNNTYVAMTGLDIFVPEVVGGATGTVNLPEHWSLAHKDLHAYNYFSVGGDTDCYVIQHTDTYTAAVADDGASEGNILSDTINKKNDSCTPLFWVGGAHNAANPDTGNVYVLNDVIVGADPTGAGNHALKLTAEGVIKQKDGLTIDKDGRIIAKGTVAHAIGDLKAGEHYVVDPAYTSTMNDIRLASRGGVRLSDILPNYILKDQKVISECDGSADGPTGNCHVDKPTCPTGYEKALVIIPTSWNKKGLQVDVDAIAGNLGVDVGNIASHLKVESAGSTNIVSSGRSEMLSIEKTGSSKVPVENDNTGLCVKIGGGRSRKAFEDDASANWHITLGSRDDDAETFGDKCKYDEKAEAIAQTYCYWAPSLYDGDRASCEAAGYAYDAGASKKCGAHGVDTDAGDAVVGAERSQTTCEAAGYRWEDNRCQVIYKLAEQINSAVDMDLHQKAAACAVIGGTWTWSGADKSAGSCS